MSRLHKAQQPIIADLATGLLATLLWFVPVNLKLGPIEVGATARLSGYFLSLLYWSKSYLASEELLQQAAKLLELDAVDQAVELDKYKHQQAVGLQAAETHTNARYLEAVMPAEQKIQQLQAATQLQPAQPQQSVPQVQPVAITPATNTANNASVPEARQNQGASDRLSVLLGTAQGKPYHWTPAENPNGFFLMLGASGSGKTETLKAIAHEIHTYGIPCLVIDFHGDIVLEGANTYLLSHGPASTHGINPMELESLDPADGGVYAQTNILLSMLQSAIPSMGHRQYEVLKQVITTAYHCAGISDSDPKSWSNRPPTFRDVLRILNEWTADASDKGQRGVLESARAVVSRVFEHPIFARQRQISIQELTSHSTRLDLSRLSEKEVRFIAADTVLRKVSRALKSQGPIPVQPRTDRERYRLFTFVDEAKIIASKDRDDSNAILNELATEYRKFGWGMVVASQISDHFSPEFKGQMACRLVLKPFEFDEAKENSQQIGLAPEALMELKGRGDGYLKIGNNPAVRIQVTPLSDRTTNPGSNTSNPTPGTDSPQDMLKQWKARLEASLQAELPADSGHPEAQTPNSAQSASPEPALPEADPPTSEAQEARNSAASEPVEVLPREELKAGLQRLIALFQEAGSTVERAQILEFTQLAQADPVRALWLGMKLLKLSQRQAIMKVFGRSAGGKGHYEAAPWYQSLKDKFGTISEDNNG